jgi:hypothetical protein
MVILLQLDMRIQRSTLVSTPGRKATLIWQRRCMSLLLLAWILNMSLNFPLSVHSLLHCRHSLIRLYCSLLSKKVLFAFSPLPSVCSVELFDKRSHVLEKDKHEESSKRTSPHHIVFGFQECDWIDLAEFDC